MSKQVLTRDEIVSEIRYRAAQRIEFSLHHSHDRLCSNTSDSAYFDRVINQLVAAGEIKRTREGFAIGS